MKPTKQEKPLRPPPKIEAIQDELKAGTPAADVSTKVGASTPAVVLPAPRQPKMRPQAATPVVSDVRLIAPSEGSAWGAASGGSQTFSSSSGPIEMPESPSGSARSQPARWRHRLRPTQAASLARPLEARPTRADHSQISFTCPACHHSISLPLLQAGQKARCPQCSSAIRAPQLHTLGQAHNYERSVESLLHPEHFSSSPRPQRRLLGMPWPKMHQLLLGVAVAIVALGGFQLTRFRGAVAPINHGPQTITLETKLQQDVFDPVADAEKLVTAFLVADNWQTRARFVRDPIRVGKLLEQYYPSERLGHPLPPVSVIASAPTYYYNTEQLKHRHNMVEVEMPDGLQHHFIVEFLPEGPKIEWESSVAYVPVAWPKMLATADPNTVYLQRVCACLDDYYNHEFSDHSAYISLYLQDPNTGASLGNGYLLRDSAAAVEVLAVLGPHNRQHLKRVMIEVRPRPTSAKNRLIEITRFIKSGFRSPEGSTVVSVE